MVYRKIQILNLCFLTYNLIGDYCWIFSKLQRFLYEIAISANKLSKSENNV